jgi:hypothetical protein
MWSRFQFQYDQFLHEYSHVDRDGNTELGTKMTGPLKVLDVFAGAGTVGTAALAEGVEVGLTFDTCFQM